MATAIKNPGTPGVKIQEDSKFPPSIAAVATAIPAFIGYTEKAERGGVPIPDFEPVRIVSLLEYEQHFGFAMQEGESLEAKVVGDNITVKFKDDQKPSYHTMYHSMQAYFANGGGPCYIVSVGKYGDDAPKPALAKLTDGLKALAKEDEPTLIVFPEAQGLVDDQPVPPVAAEDSQRLNDYASLIDAALKQCQDLQDRFVIADLHDGGEKSDLTFITKEFRNKVGANKDDLKYGAVYFPNIRTVFDYRIDETKIDVTIDDAAAVKLNTLEGTNSDQFNRIKQKIADLPVTLPACGAIAGVYARVDSRRGVWKAPANEGLLSVSGLTLKITDASQENLNIDSLAGKSINAIRSFAGRGTIVWGARTLDGNSNEWRYISVRRFFNMVEESAKNASGRFVFEPNDARTWVKVQGMIENFLLLQWRDGALQGAKPEDAFYVRVGLNQTMSAIDILEGRMIVEIGMAVVRPAEFIILRFSHKMPVS